MSLPNRTLLTRHQSLQLKTGIDHISKVTSNVERAVQFYVDVLGFTPICRPSSFDFGGAWLWRYGIALHFIEGNPVSKSAKLDPKADHISFQAENMADVEVCLTQMGIPYIKETVEDLGVQVEQIFFMDPDCNTIEICNCGCLPIRPLGIKADVGMMCGAASSGPESHQETGSGSCYSSDSEHMRVSIDLTGNTS